MNVYTGKLLGNSQKIAIIVSRFNEFISSKLLSGAIDTLTRHEVLDNNISVFWVPGAFEIPLLAKKLADKNKFDAVICLGAVIRGETMHFEYVASEVSKGISNVSLETGVPIIFGVLTTENLEQAVERAGVKSGNKGSEAALVAIEMINLYRSIENI